VRVADQLDYSNAVVSRTMDGVQRYIANADDRPADEIERAEEMLGLERSEITSRTYKQPEWNIYYDDGTPSLSTNTQSHVF